MNLKNLTIILLILFASTGIAVSDNSYETTTYSNNSSQYGNLVWDEFTASSTEYTWDAKTFLGFYYDLDSGKFSESLTIHDISRTIEEGDIVYESQAMKKNFEHAEWGEYSSIGFLGEDYFVAYTNNTTIDGIQSQNMLSAGQLSIIVAEKNEPFVIFSGSSITLEEGYSLDIVEINTSENTLIVSLIRDGNIIEQKSVASNSDYVYKTNLGVFDNVTLVAVHFKDIFSSTPNGVFVEGIFQLADDFIELDAGNTFSEMEIMSVNDETIIMKNDENILLSKGSTISLMGDIIFEIADDDILRFKPSIERRTPGVYEQRGTVADNQTSIWTPLNFGGLYCDLNTIPDDENLSVDKLSGRIIESGDLKYTTTIQEIDYKTNYISSESTTYLTKYPVIGLFGERYVPLTNKTPDRMTKLLLDDDEKHVITLKESIDINDNYTVFLKALDIEKKKAWLELYRDGEEVHDQILTVNSSDALIYEEDLFGEDRVNVMRIHVTNLSLSQTLTIDGIWLRDDQNVLDINEGDSFGKLQVSEIGNDYIKMTNDQNINLLQNTIVDVTEDLSFKVADDATLRYYPFTEITVPPALKMYGYNPYPFDFDSYEGNPVTFAVKLNEVGDVTWTLDGKIVCINESIKSASYTNNNSTTGTHILQVKAQNENGSYQRQWTWNITESPLEFIKVEPARDCSIDIGDSKDFYVNTGKNSTINWYLDNTLVQSNLNVSEANYTFDSFINNSSLSIKHHIKAVATHKNETYEKEWKCSVKSRAIMTGQQWQLKDGYALTPFLLDKTGDKVLINLTKNDELVDQHIVVAENYYCYNRTINEIDRTILKVYVSDIYQDQVDGLIAVTKIDQYSDTETNDTDPTKLMQLDESWSFGNNYFLKPLDIDADKNYCLLVLNKDNTIVDTSIMGNNETYVYQRLNGSTNQIETILKLPLLNMIYSRSGEGYVEFSNSYDIYPDANTDDIDNRSILVQYQESWNLDEDYSLKIEEISDEKALVSLQKANTIIDYEIIEENSIYTYNRYNVATGKINPIITINSSQIFEGNSYDYIEFDSEYQVNPDAGTVSCDDKVIITSDEPYKLNEGYNLSLVTLDLNSNKIFINLTKDGQLLDQDIVKNGEYYYFNKTFNGNEQTIISFLLENTFSGESNKIAIIKNIIQNPDVSADETNITIIQKEEVLVRSPLYTGYSLNDIIGNESTDFIEINATEFAGFFYDFDRDVKTETLQIFGGDYINGNTILENGTAYTTTITPIEYESDNLEGNYNVVGLFGEIYVPLESNKPNELAPLLVDSDKKIVLRNGHPLELPNGYVIEINQIDIYGEKVWMKLSKDGEFVEDEIIDVSDGETWIYDEDVEDTEDVIVMEMNITDILQDDSYYCGSIIIEGLWLIDFENILQIKTGDQFGNLQLNEIGTNYLKFGNPENIILERNSTIKLANDFFFDVDDTDNLNFCIARESNDTNVNEIQGSVVENPPTVEWTGENFEGFNYEFGGITDNEKLFATISSRTIEENNLAYETTTVQVAFKHNEWGNYSAIGFFGGKYLAGFDNSTVFCEKSTDLLSNAVLSRVLLDNDEKYIIYPDSALVLENGYELSVLDINASNNSISLILRNNDLEIDNCTIEIGSDYTYNTDFSENNQTTIAVHFSEIMNETGSECVSVQGLFQTSDEFVNLYSSDIFGELEITDISSYGIRMENAENITLSKDSTVEITENIYFKVADCEDVRLYPFMQVTTPSLAFVTLGPINQSIKTDTNVCQIFTVNTNKDCKIIWLIDGSEMQENTSCLSACFTYIPASSGTYNVTVVSETTTESIQYVWTLIVDSDETNTKVASSSSSGGSGGGGGGTSGEDYENILKKEVVLGNINKDMESTYNFEEELNPVESIKFTALKNAGSISATIEVLKDKSSFADEAAPDEVYRYMNIWVGKTGFATPTNIEDVKIMFRVEKVWMEENDIQESAICLCRYDAEIWNELVTEKYEDDDDYVYYVSETSGFSTFAITGKTTELGSKTDTSFSLQDSETESAGQKPENTSSKSTPGLGIVTIIAIFSLNALVTRRRK
ncbi:S-layer protein domain-containing protein [uncultured Methanolobus sp.]|uniref:S-layer protein domain-containing protein n=1 Tax=uncultured Methanolobus sp. TaxID=218300 RepID=UPI002AABE499|nr:S-layer protein domain-containing protein [uncultured Methanolobus sp.]